MVRSCTNTPLAIEAALLIEMDTEGHLQTSATYRYGQGSNR